MQLKSHKKRPPKYILKQIEYFHFSVLLLSGKVKKSQN